MIDPACVVAVGIRVDNEMLIQGKQEGVAGFDIVGPNGIFTQEEYDSSDEFRKTGKKDALKKYYDEYIFGCETYDDFLAKVGYKKLRELRDMDGGQPIILS